MNYDLPTQADTAVEVGARIHAARTARGYTQRQLAAMLGYGQTTISHWECGQVPGMTVADLIAVAGALKVPTAVLMPAGPAPTTAVTGYDPCCGTGWVCEGHRAHPAVGPHACLDGPGQPCPACTPHGGHPTSPGAVVLADILGMR
jgi:DNA-binding XRE family transcriptional regulator